MHPYRDSFPPPDRPARLPPEEGVLYVLLVVIGAIPVVTAVSGASGFGVDATLGLVMVCAGALGVVRHLGRRRGA